MQGLGQMKTCQLVSESWLQQGHRALSHLPHRLSSCPVAEWPETNLEYHNWYRGWQVSVHWTRQGNWSEQSQWRICAASWWPYTCMSCSSQDARWCMAGSWKRWPGYWYEETSFPTRRPTWHWLCCRRQRRVHLVSWSAEIFSCLKWGREEVEWNSSWCPLTCSKWQWCQ